MCLKRMVVCIYSWGILFSHPADFTPVCTTELARVAQLYPEFARRNVKPIALSCDNVESHLGWIKDIKSYASNVFYFTNLVTSILMKFSLRNIRVPIPNHWWPKSKAGCKIQHAGYGWNWSCRRTTYVSGGFYHWSTQEATIVFAVSSQYWKKFWVSTASMSN